MIVNQKVPIVIEPSGRTERVYDIYSRLLEDRIVFLGGPIDEYSANLIIAQMLFLSNKDSKKDVHFYINSPGGAVTATLAIYDTMQFLRCDVATYCIGQAASGGAILLLGGTKGKRNLLGNSTVLLHQPLVPMPIERSATDQQIEAEEMLRLRERLYHIIATHTGKDLETVEKDCDRNYWMGAEEAINYGLADRILQKAPEIVRDKDKNQQNKE